MSVTQQIRDIYKALNNLHGVLNEQAGRIDQYLNHRCDSNQSEINQNSDALIEVSQDLDVRVTELDDAVIEVSQDADTRITELEDAVIELANTIAGEE